MPVQIGPVPSSVDLVDILLACHDRIRTFADSAVRLAAPGTPAEEIRDAASRIRYYFRAAFPAHLQDEDDTVLPRLHGCGAEIDEALATMERQHDEHAPLLARLLTICDMLAEDPSRHGGLAGELAALAGTLHGEFARHLALEEAVLWPAIRERLPRAVQDEMLYEARARRGDG